MAFQSIITLFGDSITPYAADICKHFNEQYLRSINSEVGRYHGRSYKACIAALISMRSILDVIKENQDQLLEVEPLLHACLMHSLESEDQIKDGIYCITVLAYHGFKNKPLTDNMWKLYPEIFKSCIIEDLYNEENNGGYGI